MHPQESILWKGNNSTVKRIVTKDEDYIIKIPPHSYSNHGILREVHFLTQLQHIPYLSKLLSLNVDHTTICSKLEYIKGKTLDEHLSNRSPREQIFPALIDTLYTLRSFGDHHLVHGDLSTHNLVIDVTGRGHIIDLGNAITLDKKSMVLYNRYGTPSFDSPEKCLPYSPISLSIDWYAAAMMVGYTCIYDSSENRIPQFLKERHSRAGLKKLVKCQGYPSALAEALSLALHPDADQRLIEPLASELCNYLRQKYIPPSIKVCEPVKPFPQQDILKYGTDWYLSQLNVPITDMRTYTL